MLNDAQKNYLNMLSDTEIVVIKPWDARASEVAARLLKELRTAVPALEVFWSGALALGIAGVNDIDFSVVSKKEDYGRDLPALIAVLGEPQKRSEENIRWEITREGYPVDVHLCDGRAPALAEHKETYKLLKNDPELLREYEKLKFASNGLSVREYQKRKYEFYNRIIGLDES